MDYFRYNELNSQSNNIVCCELVFKIRQYLNILHAEANRLSGVQLECNELLDKFYPLKREFDSLIKEVLPIKYLGENGEECSESQELIDEFSIFYKSVWQLGKFKFLEKGKTINYTSFVGKPLTELMSMIQSFVEEVKIRLTYTPYHSDCAAILNSICAQVGSETLKESLSTADACIRQYTYLQCAIPFLKELLNLVNHYLLTPDVHSPKGLYERAILRLPSVEKYKFKRDTEDTLPFRFVVDLLTGRLFGDQVLDQHSEIKPIVEDDINLQRSKIVIDTVSWIMSQYKSETVPKAFVNFVPPLIVPDCVERKKHAHTVFASSLFNRSPEALQASQAEILDLMDQLDWLKTEWLYSSNSFTPTNRSRGRGRGRKTEISCKEPNSSSDLQPINLQTLQSPLLRPLI